MHATFIVHLVITVQITSILSGEDQVYYSSLVYISWCFCYILYRILLKS